MRKMKATRGYVARAECQRGEREEIYGPEAVHIGLYLKGATRRKRYRLVQSAGGGTAVQDADEWRGTEEQRSWRGVDLSIRQGGKGKDCTKESTGVEEGTVKRKRRFRRRQPLIDGDAGIMKGGRASPFRAKAGSQTALNLS